METVPAADVRYSGRPVHEQANRQRPLERETEADHQEAHPEVLTFYMKQLREDLWQTTATNFEGAYTVSHLLRQPAGNVLLYNTLADADLDEIAELRGSAGTC